MKRRRFNTRMDPAADPAPGEKKAATGAPRDTFADLETWEQAERLARRQGIVLSDEQLNAIQSSFDAVSAACTSPEMERLLDVLGDQHDELWEQRFTAALQLALADGAVKRRMEARRKAHARATKIADRNAEIVEDARRLLAAGATRKQVAARLGPEHGLSPRTVQNLLSRLL